MNLASNDLARDIKSLEGMKSETDYNVYFVKVDKDGNYSCPIELCRGLETEEDYKEWLAVHDTEPNCKFVLCPNKPIYE